MNKFRFLTAGESHGKCLTAIIEGLPSGITIDTDFINNELQRRQQGYGRGDRMKIESDTVEITSGVRFGKTLGSPITLVVKNRDFDSWKKIMSVAPEDITDEKAFSTYRPGHADFAGSVKYHQQDLRNILERSSARKTAIEVAVGAVAKLLLKELNISGSSKILQIGSACCPADFHDEVDIMKGKGDTIGGRFVVTYENLPIGLGSHVHWDRTLDGKLAQAVMSIPAVKVVEIGTRAFYNCQQMTSVQIPDTVKTIKEYAFNKCLKLTKIEIPVNVENINFKAFEECTNLSTININKKEGSITGAPWGAPKGMKVVNWNG